MFATGTNDCFAGGSRARSRGGRLPQICVYIYIYMYIYIYTHIHIYIYIYIVIHINRPWPLPKPIREVSRAPDIRHSRGFLWGLGPVSGLQMLIIANNINGYVTKRYARRAQTSVVHRSVGGKGIGTF